MSENTEFTINETVRFSGTDRFGTACRRHYHKSKKIAQEFEQKDENIVWP